jgi:tripartite ATP-independent transporter DctM subunit
MTVQREVVVEMLPERVEAAGSAQDLHVLQRVDSALAWIIGFPAALAVLAEIAVLLTGITARSVFHAPLAWSDELASILFPWLAMLGSAVALQRGEHMRLGYAVLSAPPRVRSVLTALGIAAPIMFLLLILNPSFEYYQDQSFMTTPALGWSGGVRAAAIPVGSVLMLLVAALRLARAGLWNVVIAVAVLLAASSLLYLFAPWVTAAGNWNLVLFFVLVLGASVFAGVPIAFSFGLATTAYLLTTDAGPTSIVVGRMDEGMGSLILLAVPLFVLLGQLMVLTNMAALIVEFLAAVFGHLRGGLSYVLLGAMILVSGISGSKAADMAAVAPVLFPDMRRRGTPDGELVALLTSAGAMSETIPPSIVLITIGSVTSVSIAGLFTAGLLPGLLLAIILGVVAWLRSPPPGSDAAPRATMAKVWRSFVVALPALALPILIRFAVARGVATATEVSTIGIAYVVLVGLLVYRRFDWRKLPGILVETAGLSGAILLIIGTATSMAWALTQSGFSDALARAMQAMPGGGFGFLVISMITFVLLGSILEGIPAIVLFGPLLFPIARQAGVNEIHYAIVVVLAMGLGLFAPPFGVGYYTACLIGKVSPDLGMRRIWPYFGALAIGLILIAAVPWFSTGFL